MLNFGHTAPSSGRFYKLANPVDARDQGCKKIAILDIKYRDLFIDLDLLHDLDQFIDLLKLILIFDS